MSWAAPSWRNSENNIIIYKEITFIDFYTISVNAPLYVQKWLLYLYFNQQKIRKCLSKFHLHLQVLHWLFRKQKRNAEHVHVKQWCAQQFV